VCLIVLSCLLVIFHSTADLDLSWNSLKGTIPSQLAMMPNLCESSVVWLLVVMIVLSCVFSLYSHACLSFFHSTAWLDLSGNSLTGTIPSQIALMSNLCESSTVWLLVVMIMLSCVFRCTLMVACHIHSKDLLNLFSNNFTGEFTCPDFVDECWISCDRATDTYTEACRSL
jgi:hypothetical protein